MASHSVEVRFSYSQLAEIKPQIADVRHVNIPTTDNKFSIACESQTQTTTQDYLSVLTAVMALAEGEQQMIYEALYKAGHRIYSR